MKISGATLLFLAFEGASAFLGPQAAGKPSALLSTPGGDYSYTYGGNTMREGSPNINGNVPVSGADESRVVRIRLYELRDDYSPRTGS
jgi:hypothetical protein